MAGPDENEAEEGSITEPTVDASDPAEHETKRRRQRRAGELGVEFWRRCLADPVGRRELWALLNDAHTFTPMFMASPVGFPDPLATWYSAGQTNLGQRLYLSWQKIAPDLVMLMHAEHDPRFAAPPRRRRTTEE